MWRQLMFVVPSVVLLGVGATAIEATSLVHQAQASQRAAQAREARQLATIATAQRWQASGLAATLTERDAALQANADKDAQLQQKDQRIKELEQQVALKAYSLTTRSLVSGLGGGAGGITYLGSPYCAGPVSGFSCGYCTWYVATRRQVTWSGNAINWWANARGIRPEGSQPQPGAIMVTAESWWGHVAYVESVSSGSFVVSEMNYAGWGVVDSRTILPGRVPIVGFIY